MTPVPTHLLQEAKLTPMDGVTCLYGGGSDDLARALVASLGRRIFESDAPRPSNFFRRRLAAGVFHLMRGTTRNDTRPGPDGHPVVFHRNRILERSGHPYAATMLEPSRADTAAFVEGGDPMNALYMMLVPEIRRQAGLWDHIILDSVQARDVQWRFYLGNALRPRSGLGAADPRRTGPPQGRGRRHGIEYGGRARSPGA